MYKISKYINELIYKIEGHWVNRLIFFAGLIITGFFIIYSRYPFAVSHANFYAEDGSIFLMNLAEKGFIGASSTLFNGYLVLGLYFIAELARVGNIFFGNGFATLPQAFAIASFLTIAITCALPWALLRAKFGYPTSLLIWAALLYTPLGGYDYAVLGTIGNLKFLFLFIATLLIVYRTTLAKNNLSYKLIIVDAFLLLSVLTNIFVVALLPFLINDLKEFRNIVRVSRWHSLSIFTYWTLGLIAIAFTYAVTIYINGVTESTKYLDGNINPIGLINTVFVSSAYIFTFYLPKLPHVISIFLVVLTFTLLIKESLSKKWIRVIVIAILVNSIAFAVVRPGVTELLALESTGGWPVHFFYGGTMICLTAIIAIVAKKVAIIPLSIGVIIFIMFSTHFGGNRSESFESYRARGTFRDSITNACNETLSDQVKLDIYPDEPWNITVPREQACQIK